MHSGKQSSILSPKSPPLEDYAAILTAVWPSLRYWQLTNFSHCIFSQTDNSFGLDIQVSKSFI